VLVRSECAAEGTTIHKEQLSLPFTVDKTGSVPDPLMTPVALGRIGSPEEVASLVVWLCMEGTYVTGQSYLIDGGWTCHP
jgi:NAD(P)-dependent dehydrogenase (short-subunit alcohol dehydrogenase family)